MQHMHELSGLPKQVPYQLLAAYMPLTDLHLSPKLLSYGKLG